MMRRVRTSTWILIGVFLVALAAYFLLKPEPAAGQNRHPGVPVTIAPGRFW